MTDEDIKRLSPFRNATVNTAVTVEISLVDVLAMEPTCSPESAQEFLRRHSSSISSAMYLAGMSVVERIIHNDVMERPKNREN